MGQRLRNRLESSAYKRLFAQGILGLAGIPLFILLIARHDVILREQRPAFFLAWAALFFVAFMLMVLFARCAHLARLLARWNRIKAACGASGRALVTELSAALNAPADALTAGLYALIDFGVLPPDAIDLKRGLVVAARGEGPDEEAGEEPGTALAPHRTASTVPVYLAGSAFSAYCFLLPVFAPIPAAAGLVLFGLVFAACRKLFPGRVVLREVSGAVEPLESMRSEDFFALYDRRIDALNAAAGQIENAQLCESARDLGSIASSLGQLLREQPQDIPKVRQFVKYYLPMTTKMLCDYREMEGYGEKGASVLSTMRQIEEVMPTVCVAFRQELETVQAGVAGDISADVKVLRTLLLSMGRGGVFQLGAADNAVKAGGDAK